MKFSASVLLLLPAFASAFTPAAKVVRATSSLSAAPAESFDEDLEKTRAVIASFMDGDDGVVADKAEDEAAAEAEE